MKHGVATKRSQRSPRKRGARSANRGDIIAHYKRMALAGIAALADDLDWRTRDRVEAETREAIRTLADIARGTVKLKARPGHQSLEALSRAQRRRLWLQKQEQKRKHEKVFAPLRVKYFALVVGEGKAKKTAMEDCAKEAARILNLRSWEDLRREAHFGSLYKGLDAKHALWAEKLKSKKAATARCARFAVWLVKRMAGIELDEETVRRHFARK
jgi:hypothetical protein